MGGWIDWRHIICLKDHDSNGTYIGETYKKEINFCIFLIFLCLGFAQMCFTYPNCAYDKSTWEEEEE